MHNDAFLLDSTILFILILELSSVILRNVTSHTTAKSIQSHNHMSKSCRDYSFILLVSKISAILYTNDYYMCIGLEGSSKFYFWFKHWAQLFLVAASLIPYHLNLSIATIFSLTLKYVHMITCEAT